MIYKLDLASGHILMDVRLRYGPPLRTHQQENGAEKLALKKPDTNDFTFIQKGNWG